MVSAPVQGRPDWGARPLEVVLQLLDEIEDLCCAVAFSWDRLRLPLLVTGLASASALLAFRASSPEWPAASPALAAIALTSLVVWTTALLASVVRTSDRRDSQSMA